MNLWFRLIGLLFSRPWRSKVTNKDHVAVIKLRVWPTDLDLNRHVTNGRYFAFGDIARIDFALKTGTHKVAWKHKATAVVGDTWGKFRKELKLFEVFEIHTKIVGWDEKWFYFKHHFVRNERIVGVVVVRGLFKTRSYTVPPQEFFRELGFDDTPPEKGEWLECWSKSCDLMSEEIREFENSDNINPLNKEDNT